MKGKESFSAHDVSESPFGKERFPLSFVPKDRNISKELESVAGHELNHALVAYRLGIAVEKISVIREGNSLGRTQLISACSDEAIKIVAAAGGIDTHQGSAEGYVSDKFKVDLLQYFTGGASWESAKAIASGIIFSYSSEVRQKASEIIAYLGEVSGSMLSEIISRAEYEVKIEKYPVVTHKDTHVKPDVKIDEYTIIDTLSDGTQRITKIKDGHIVNEEKIYPCCGGKNAHSQECNTGDVEEEGLAQTKEYVVFPLLSKN